MGNETRVKVVKNKVAPPFRQAEFQILYGKGIYRAGEVIDLGVTCNLIEKSGSWYSYQGTRIGQGKANAAQYLEENPDTMNTIEQAIREQLMPDPNQEPPSEEKAVPAEDALRVEDDPALSESLAEPVQENVS